MKELDTQYPEYGFKVHKGYPTREHVERIKKYGISVEHRKSFSIEGVKIKELV
jgi:ribonuclease HII